MQQWEHLFIERTSQGEIYIVNAINGKQTGDNPPEFFSYIAKIGDEGWSLVVSSHITQYIFKRPKS